MKNVLRSKALLCALSFACLTTLSAAKYGGGATGPVPTETPTSRTPGAKPPFVMETGDIRMVIGGKTVQEYFFSRNAIFLNNLLPDEFGFFRHLNDIWLDVEWGSQKYGFPAMKMVTDFRQRNVWGDTGRYVRTADESVKLRDNVFGAHNHTINRPLVWMRDLWMELNLNAAFAVDDAETHHWLKGGLFPFYLGRGISLGVYYGASRSFLGLYTYVNDQSAPGIEVHGELFRDELYYDFYYSKFEERGAGFDQTFEHVKANHVGRKSRPYRGVGKDNDLWAFRLKWTPFVDEEHHDLIVEPYILYNEASDQTVEFEADTKTELGIAGLALEYSWKDFEFGGEVAFNFGTERLRHIDRDQVIIDDETLAGSSSDLELVHSHVTRSIPTSNPLRAQGGKGHVDDKHIDASRNTTNAANIGSPSGAQYDLLNAKDRFRPAFHNHFAGMMAVLDASYYVHNWDLRVAGAFGYASGDRNPHICEQNKTYNGWVGLNENYSGVRVKSVLILDARKIQRPLRSDDETSNAIVDNSFTDMYHLGLGLNWTPHYRDPEKLSFNANLLFYWKDQPECKFDRINDVFLDCKASKYLGAEINFLANYEVLKDLQVYTKLATFLPGGFYSDVRGLKLDQLAFFKLDQADGTGFDSSNYGLGSDTAYHINVGCTYAF